MSRSSSFSGKANKNKCWAAFQLPGIPLINESDLLTSFYFPLHLRCWPFFFFRFFNKWLTGRLWLHFYGLLAFQLWNKFSAACKDEASVNRWHVALLACAHNAMFCISCSSSSYLSELPSVNIDFWMLWIVGLVWPNNTICFSLDSFVLKPRLCLCSFTIKMSAVSLVKF